MSSNPIERAQRAHREGQWDEALREYEAALTRAAEESDVPTLVNLLRWIGTLHLDRGDLGLAEELYEASLTIAELNDLGILTASALIGLASAKQLQGLLGEAEERYLRAQRIAASLGETRLTAMVEQNIGSIANIRGDVEAALEHYAAALRCYEGLGDSATALRVLNNMGMAHVDLGSWVEAERCFDRAFELADHLRDASILGAVEINRAELHLKRGDLVRARECCDGAYEIFGRLGSESGQAEVCKHYGVLFRASCKPVLADSHFATAAELARRCRDRLLEAEVMSEWALVHLEEERNREALQCLNGAHHLFSELSARRELLDLDRRLDGLEGTYLRVVQAWAESIESKDLYTAGHCERVANYACMLAQAVGITGRDLTWLRMGGYLHDVGKIAVPAEVLNKPGKLTDEEFRLMQRHTVEGDSIVAELNFPWDIRPIVRWHHERWDGSGYPDGLRGEEIPLTARILCVADVYDALTTTRSYRPALSQAEALEIMLRDVGRFFDPALFPIFRSLITQTTPLPDHRFPVFGGSAVAAA